jgi:uncharacterized SAM-binding protein YcdF (DUF218 family)
MDFFLFTVKKIVSAFFYPLQLAGILWLIGIIVWIRRPRSKKGPALVAAAGIWLLVISSPLVSFIIVKPLEDMAGPYAEPAELARKGVEYIVVLGGDIRLGNLTPADRVANSSLVRVMEGIRLWKGIHGSRLVVSGGSEFAGVMASGKAMSLLAQQLGVPKDAIVLEDSSLDTEEEARLLKPLLANRKFALVTSAVHMNRSLMHFRRVGLDPFPAPADFQVKKFRHGVRSFFPSVDSLTRSQAGVHEYLGTLFLILKQRGFGGMQPLSG